MTPFLSRVEEYNYLLKNVWSPYNTQNTLFTRSLFPLAFVWPFSGRYDDIFASFAWRQYIFCNDKFVHVGEPFNEQQVRPRNLLADLEAEAEGIQQCQAVHQAVSFYGSVQTGPGGRPFMIHIISSFFRSIADGQANELRNADIWLHSFENVIHNCRHPVIVHEHATQIRNNIPRPRINMVRHGDCPPQDIPLQGLQDLDLVEWAGN